MCLVEEFTVTTPLWRWQSASAPAAWFFVTIAGDEADGIRMAAMTGQWLDGRKGFGSARVEAVLGDTRWKTSVFPHKESGEIGRAHAWTPVTNANRVCPPLLEKK